MNVLDIWQNALWTALLVSAPFLLAALAVGLVTSLLQAATQLQENVLSFVPKIVAMGLVLGLLGPWVLDHLGRYTKTSMQSMVRMGEP